jgi:predicted transcriptional regulator of viral defense system
MISNINETSETEGKFVKTNDFTKRNQWYQLKKMIEQGTVTKVKRGVYYVGSEITLDQHVEVAEIIPDGVFCMFTAWRYYDLSVYNPHEFYVAIRKKQKINLPAYPPIKLFYWIDEFYLLGIAEIQIDNQTVKMYDLERSVCDAMRFRNKIGIDMMSEILKNYLKRKDKNLNKLSQYAKQLRIEKMMIELITVML